MSDLGRPPKALFYVRPGDNGVGWIIDEYDGRGTWQRSTPYSRRRGEGEIATAIGEAKRDSNNQRRR